MNVQTLQFSKDIMLVVLFVVYPSYLLWSEKANDQCLAEEKNAVPEISTKCGVWLIFVENLANTDICAYAFQIHYYDGSMSVGSFLYLG